MNDQLFIVIKKWTAMIDRSRLDGCLVVPSTSGTWLQGRPLLAGRATVTRQRTGRREADLAAIYKYYPIYGVTPTGGPNSLPLSFCLLGNRVTYIVTYTLWFRLTHSYQHVGRRMDYYVDVWMSPTFSLFSNLHPLNTHIHTHQTLDRHTCGHKPNLYACI